MAPMAIAPRVNTADQRFTGVLIFVPDANQGSLSIIETFQPRVRCYNLRGNLLRRCFFAAGTIDTLGSAPGIATNGYQAEVSGPGNQE